MTSSKHTRALTFANACLLFYDGLVQRRQPVLFMYVYIYIYCVCVCVCVCMCMYIGMYTSRFL